MAFNHYAKIKRILDGQPPGWYIKRINQSTTALNFKGEKISYDHYYRIYSADHTPIKYCKFQKIDTFASIMKYNVGDLPIIE
jgi:hypothetical protein